MLFSSPAAGRPSTGKRPRRMTCAPSSFDDRASDYLYGLELGSLIPIESESDSGSDVEVDDELNLQ